MKLTLAEAAIGAGAVLEAPSSIVNAGALVATGYSIDSRTLAPGELFFAVRGDRLDVLHRGRRNQAGQVAAMRGGVGDDLVEQVDVANGRFAPAGEQVLDHQLLEDAHAQGPPVGALRGHELVHGVVTAQPGCDPALVGRGAKGEHVLVAAEGDYRSEPARVSVS